MELHVPDYVRIRVNSTWVTEHIVSYERRSDLCELSDTADFVIPIDSFTPEVYDSLYIVELYNGDTGNVFDGYITGFSFDYERGTCTIKGTDRSVLLTDYFQPSQLLASGESVDYWITYLCGIVGLSVQFDATSTVIVEEGTPLGLQFLADALMMLERKAAYYLKYDASINKIRVFRYNTSSPVINIGEDETLSANRSMGTDNSRNVVKIYGGFQFNPVTQVSTQIFSKASSNMPELVVDKTSVVASPVLRSFTSAYMVAKKILEVVNSIDDEQKITVDGFYPNVQVGYNAYINIDHAGYTFKGDRRITSLVARVEERGATTVIGVGAKCPRVSVQLPVPPIFATTTVDGVAVSWDGAENFYTSNIGLNGADALNAWSIAVNQWGQSMVLTVNGLYRRFGTYGTWSAIDPLPDPSNDELATPPPTTSGLTLAKVVDEPTRYGTFHVLTNASGTFTPARAWLYTTRDFGISWASKQLYISGSSGLMWNVYGVDIETSPMNNLYILVNGSPQINLAYLVLKTFTDQHKIYTWTRDDPTTLTEVNAQAISGIGGSVKACVYTPANHKEIVFMISHQTSATTTVLRPKIIISRSMDSGATWDELWNGDTDVDVTIPTGGNGIWANYIWYDYYGSSGDGSADFTWCCPMQTIVRGSYDGSCFPWTYKLYDGGLDIHVSAAGNVTFTPRTNTELETKTWSDQWASSPNIYYIANVYQAGSNKILDKYSNEVAIEVLVSFKSPTYLCYGTNLVAFDEIITLFVDTEADDPGEDGVTVNTPVGYTNLGVIGRHGYDDSLTYYYLVRSGSDSIWLTEGSISLGQINTTISWGGAIYSGTYTYQDWEVSTG